MAPRTVLWVPKKNVLNKNSQRAILGACGPHLATWVVEIRKIKVQSQWGHLQNNHSKMLWR
jgi:hypothetical protein